MSIGSLGLAYRYPGSAAMRFPDVQVDQGGTLLLRGPSGSGKSTWLALAGGLLTATEGEMPSRRRQPTTTKLVLQAHTILQAARQRLNGEQESGFNRVAPVAHRIRRYPFKTHSARPCNP
jgi:ABC-type nitrate/sulfonate/bicarbonate transport system ATPase subunit